MFYLTDEEAAILLHDKSPVAGNLINKELQRLKESNNRVSISLDNGAWLGYPGNGFVIGAWEDKKVKELYDYLEVSEEVQQQEDDEYQIALEHYFANCL